MTVILPAGLSNYSPYVPAGLQVYDTSVPGLEVPVTAPPSTGSTGVLGESVTRTPSSTATGGAGTGFAGTPASYYQDRIDAVNAQISRLDPQQAAGLANIDASFNAANDKMNLEESRGRRDYTTSRTNTIADNELAKNNISNWVSGRTSALQRILGLAGNSDSSAAQFAVPFAVGRSGTDKQDQVQTAFGRNLGALDTNWNDFQQNMGISRADLLKQRQDKTNSLQSSINDTRGRLLQTLAGLVSQKGQAGGMSYDQARVAAQPYVDQANGLFGTIADLSREYENPVLAANPTAYTAPTLQSYDYSQRGTTNNPAVPQQTAADISPYSFLFDKRNSIGA